MIKELYERGQVAHYALCNATLYANCSMRRYYKRTTARATRPQSTVGSGPAPATALIPSWILVQAAHWDRERGQIRMGMRRGLILTAGERTKGAL